MWKTVALVVLCGLLSPSEGKPYAIRASYSPAEVSRIVMSSLMQGGLLLHHFKGIAISNVDIITGLKIVNLQFTDYEHVQTPVATGADVTISTCLNITGYTQSDSSNLVLISLNMTFHFKYALINFVIDSCDLRLIECCVDFGAMEIISLSNTGSLLPLGKIRDSITGDINIQIWEVLKAPFVTLKRFLLDSVNVRIPFGPYGTLSCKLASLPSIYVTHASADLYIDVEVPNQGTLSIPDSAGSIDVPPLGNFTHCQAFHPELFNILLSVLAPRDPQELSCTPDKFSGSDELRNAIFALVPAENLGNVSITMNVLYIQLNLEADPKIFFGNEGIIITISLRITFFFRNADGSVSSVLVLRSSVILRAEVSLVNGRLIFTTFLSRNPLVVIASDAGITDVSSLKPHCGNLLREIFVPVFNERLAFGIPVLSIFSTVLINPIFQIIKGVLVACI